MQSNNWQFSSLKEMEIKEKNIACRILEMCSMLGICNATIWTYANGDFFRIETF
jgi:hypothetical protein